MGIFPPFSLNVPCKPHEIHWIVKGLVPQFLLSLARSHILMHSTNHLKEEIYCSTWWIAYRGIQVIWLFVHYFPPNIFAPSRKYVFYIVSTIHKASLQHSSVSIDSDNCLLWWESPTMINSISCAIVPHFAQRATLFLKHEPANVIRFE